MTVFAKIGKFIKFSLKTSSEEVAVIRTAIAHQAIRALFSEIRGQSEGDFPGLNALAENVYKFYQATCASYSGAPNNRFVYEINMHTRVMAQINNTVSELDYSCHRLHDIYPRFAENYPFLEYRCLDDEVSEAAVESRVGAITSWYLAQEHIQLSQLQRSKLIFRVDTLWRNVLGNGSTSDKQLSVAQTEHQLASKARDPVSLRKLFNQWKVESSPTFDTAQKWHMVLNDLAEFLTHDDAQRISAKDLGRWKEHLLSKGNLQNQTIRATYFPAVKRIFSLAEANGLIDQNVSRTLKISVKTTPGMKKVGYTFEEIDMILTRARTERNNLHRWHPWLAALTGARARELTQLWAINVQTQGSFSTISISSTEDGGRVKNQSSSRIIPIHPALIREGFLDFVESRQGLPLFYGNHTGDPEKIHPAKVLVTRQGEWIRRLGLDHTNKAPNHAFRHWFKSVAVKVQIPGGMADAIQGHASSGEAAKYRHYDMKDLYDAICKIPAPL